MENFLAGYHFYFFFIFGFFPLFKNIKKKSSKIFNNSFNYIFTLEYFDIFNFNTKFVLRISGLPRLNLFRKILWKISLKNPLSYLSLKRNISIFKKFKTL